MFKVSLYKKYFNRIIFPEAQGRILPFGKSLILYFPWPKALLNSLDFPTSFFLPQFEEDNNRMELLKQRIIEQGQVLPGDIVKVDNFLNHKVDIPLLDAVANEFISRFGKDKPNLILTVEASGIAVAYPVAEKMGLPMLFAKKGQAKNIGQDVFSADVHSYTRGTTYGVYVSKKYLNADSRVLIIDDFLANGQVSLGLLSICAQAQAEVIGIGIVIEKKWQRGSELLRQKGVRLESLAVIEKIVDGQVQFESK